MMKQVRDSSSMVEVKSRRYADREDGSTEERRRRREVGIERGSYVVVLVEEALFEFQICL